jgi:hypothetical protein
MNVDPDFRAAVSDRSWRSLMASAVSSLRTAFARERGLVLVGGAGVVVAVVCLVGVAVRGRSVPPEGKMLDAATFCFGVGVFTLTVALLLPLAGFTAAGRRRWRRAFYVFAVYGLAVESIRRSAGSIRGSARKAEPLTWWPASSSGSRHCPTRSCS